MTPGLRSDVAGLHDVLLSWLRSDAYPLWATRGVDTSGGGFHERLSQSAEPLSEPRRARVQPRQMYAFARAQALGWRGDGGKLVVHGLDYFLARFRRPDGLFAPQVGADHARLERSPLLYDQAFALLGLAAAFTVGGRSGVAHEADRLRANIDAFYRRPGGGFETAVPPLLPLQSNPHMHLLEASLAWREATHAAEWKELADEVGQLALSTFVDAGSGAVREFFDASWRPAPGIDGRILEPGHQFEWACLLMQWNGQDPNVRAAALRLIHIGERFGVRNGHALNALLDDCSVLDGTARLWPQTERLRAAAVAAWLTGEQSYWQIAKSAATVLLEYLGTPVAGLWRDRRLSSGEFVVEPAPASTLYHIVTAIDALHVLVSGRMQAQTMKRGVS